MNTIVRKSKIRVLAFAIVTILLILLIFASANIGSLKVNPVTMFKGLFIEYIESVSTIFDLRFPRIVISVLAGAAIAVSGLLFQAVLKNPLADPGIIGITSGAGFMAVVISAFAPGLIFLSPIMACLGGIIAFLLVYSLSWKGGLSPIRIILVGLAIQSFFSGLSSAFNSMTGGSASGVASIVESNITMKTWEDVKVLFPFVLVGLTASLMVAGKCNLLALEDKTARGLGINVNRQRIIISVIACLLACSSTAIVGSISFLGLIVPHMGRLIVGSDHKKLIPFSMLLGAFVFLLADTIGRSICYPYEISAAIVMCIIGGPFFIVLLRRSKKYA